jgi:G:T/U-mismatch repair DNA glycosylase
MEEGACVQVGLCTLHRQCTVVLVTLAPLKNLMRCLPCSHPSNHMWRLLMKTGIAPPEIRGAEDDDKLPAMAGVVSATKALLELCCLDQCRMHVACTWFV